MAIQASDLADFGWSPFRSSRRSAGAAMTP